MTGGTQLPGDQIAGLVRAHASSGPLPDRERNGGTDPESVAEFVAYDIPFDVEPATGFAFPGEETGRG